MDGIFSLWPHLLWLLPLLALAWISSPRFRGDIAESRVRRLLDTGLDRQRYTVLNDVVVPAGGGTVHIDHIVISKFGIFVIESRYVRGWVSGEEFQDRWKQSNWRRTVRFDNPMALNHRQQQALEKLLELPRSRFHGLVVLVGHKGAKKPLPGHVVPAEKVIPWVRRKGQLLLDDKQAARALRTIESARLSPRSGMNIDRRAVARLVLLLLVAVGLYLAFREPVRELLRRTGEAAATPAGGSGDTMETTRQKYEESLLCAYSADTGRCSCYEPNDGPKVEIEPSRCRELAERGSILRQ